MIERSGDTVCSLYRAQGDEERGFFSLKIKVDSFSWFDLKTGGYGSYGLTSKLHARVFWFEPQNRRFDDLVHKIIMTLFWFVSQNQVGYDLSSVPQN
jgi:hypothetical protein